MKKQENVERIAAAGSCLLMLIAFYAVFTTVLATHTLTIQLLMQVGVLIMVGAAVWIMLTHPELDRSEIFLWLILVLGILMRVGYMLYTPAYVRGHDLGKCSLDSNGHVAYILHLLQGELPPNNSYQFYHPPLFHALSAIAMACYRALSGFSDPGQLLEAAKTVSCAASIVTLFYARNLCRQLRLSDEATLIAVSLAAFLPNHYLLAGRVNNDSLAVMFMTAILYYTLRWYKRQEWGALVKLALCFGLGMMTKISVGVFALVTGCVMILVLYRRLREKNGLPIIRQFVVFGLIAFPLGLWYPIRNLILFQQPFNYVLRISEESEVYCGGYSLWERFGLIKNFEIYDHPFEDYNVWSYLLKGSLFGEFSFNMGKVIPGLLILINLLLILLSLAAMALVLIRHRTAQWTVLICFWLVLMGSYINFNIQYPFGCTMDFRYVVPTALIGAVFLAKWWEEIPQNRKCLFRKGVVGLTGLYAIFSLVLCCNLTW
ncbi:MAG: glycosyltransferase family 39 protein [Bacillota bacterium]|nr:glycosyltransferase family 39 protein [Bacillota bacterium]